MKNKYVGTCTVCKDPVLPGAGTLTRLEGKWAVTHSDPCEGDPLQGESVQSYQARRVTRHALSVLDDLETSEDELEEVVSLLAKLSSLGWGDPEMWRARVMVSYAARPLDRLDLEMVLDRHLPFGVRNRP